MSSINLFSTQSDYTNHTKSTTNSEVSFVTETDKVHYDGLNVENLGTPAIGDCLYLDSNQNKHFFRGATVNNAKLVEAGYTPVGIISEKYGRNKGLLIYKEENESVQFCSAVLQILSGFKIDGTANNISVRWFNSSNVKTVLENTFTESCSSLEDFVTKFDAFLRENQVTSYQWHCELMPNYSGVDSAFVVIDNYNHYYQYQSIIESGASASMYNWNTVGQTTDYASVRRISGGQGFRTGCNKEQLIRVYTTGATVTDGLTDSPTNGSGIVNKVDFDNNVYPNIKAYYGDWESYIDSILMQRKPNLKGSQIAMPDASELTKKMAQIEYAKLDGTTAKLFTVANWCASLTALNSNWYLTGINELNDIFIKIKSDATDPINVAMLNMSNKRIIFSSGSTYYYRWVCARRSGSSAWLLTGHGYFNGYYYLHYRYRAVACQLLSF